MSVISNVICIMRHTRIITTTDRLRINLIVVSAENRLSNMNSKIVIVTIDNINLLFDEPQRRHRSKSIRKYYNKS